MCGIVGIASREASFEPTLAVAMRDTLAHRGPDDAGLWSTPNGSVWLGQRRLSILDLSEAGHQPMSDIEGRCTVTFNGEIYNYRELRTTLEQIGHRFRTRTDTEVLLVAYRQWGDACLERFNGMFAFAIHDRDRKRLFLARDRAGEKPLFYWHGGGRFAFASELKALLAPSRLPAAMSRHRRFELLSGSWLRALGENCILAGIRKLEPAHSLAYDLETEHVDVRRYWRLPQSDRSTNVGETELIDELETRLLESVRLRLHADVPVGVLLSGGIDSSLVTAMAARSHPNVKTFTITFPGDAFDESQFAREVAEALGTQHSELAAQPANADLLPLLAAQYDEPIADSSMVPTYLVAKMIREHATVALGGDGGDELFGGYQHYGWVAQQAQMRRIVPSAIRRAMSFAGQTMIPPVHARPRWPLGGGGEYW